MDPSEAGLLFLLPMNSTVSIRDYGIGDWIEMFRLDEQCFVEPFRFDLTTMRSFAENPRAVVRVAMQDDGAMIGFVIIHIEERPHGRIGYVVTLDVAQAWRRRGVAAMLVRDVEERAERAGAVAMELHVYTENASAIRFYEKMGYSRYGLHEHFYGRVGLSAFEYSKRLRAE